VATEVDRHAELTIAAVEAGKHILVEKPMALDAQQCRSMIDAAQRNGVRLSVAYYVRFFEKPGVMKDLIDRGALGQIVRANVRVMYLYDPAPDNPEYWRVTARGGGNVLADVGSHRLDLLTYFFGRPTKVWGLVDRLTMGYEAADTETGLVQYENGAHVTILANANVGPASSGLTVEIYGTEGALVTDPWSNEPVQVVGSDMQPIAVSPPANAHGPMIDDFARAILQGRAPRFSGVDGMWATAIIAGVYESARSGKIVALPS
jgi:predicted dehydrogenase